MRSLIMTSNNELELCDCGRPRLRRHCPSCGLATGYALKDKVKMRNPATGLEEEVNQYRCRNCNRYYNDFDREFNCKAPIVTRKNIQKEQANKITADELQARVMAGEELDHNDQLKFRRLCGFRYEEFRLALGLHKITPEQAKANREKAKQYIPKPAPPTSVDGFKSEETMEELEDYLKDE